MSFKAIVPKGINAAALARAVTNGLTGAAKGAQADFETTTATWQHKPAFTIRAPDPGSRIVSTGDAIYHFVDGGTKAHVIRPKKKRLRFGTGGSPKTTPGVIGSSAGRAGSGAVFARVVKHPGTKARGFSKAIATKWQGELAGTLQRAIDAEVR